MLLGALLAALCTCATAASLSTREQCDACLTVMEAQQANSNRRSLRPCQAIWKEVGTNKPAAEIDGKFVLTADIKHQIEHLCNSTLYLQRYSTQMQAAHRCCAVSAASGGLQAADQQRTVQDLQSFPESTAGASTWARLVQGGSSPKLLMDRKWRACHQWCTFNRTALQYYRYARCREVFRD